MRHNYIIYNVVRKANFNLVMTIRVGMISDRGDKNYLPQRVPFK